MRGEGEGVVKGEGGGREKEWVRDNPEHRRQKGKGQCCGTTSGLTPFYHGSALRR